MAPPRVLIGRARAVLLVSALLSILLLGTLAGCGSGSSDSGGTDAAPATIVPASAPLYLEGAVNPTGSLKEAATISARKLTHSQNPYTSVIQALEGSKYFEHLNYNQDVKPWIGERAGLFVTSLSLPSSAASTFTQKLEGNLSSEALLSAAQSILTLATKHLQGALVLQAADLAKARSFLSNQTASKGAHAVTYRGVSYDLDGEGVAWGIVGSYVVIGSESGVRGTIDTQLGGPSLLHAAPYEKLEAVATSGELAALYIDSSALASAHSSVPGLSLLEDLLPGEEQIRLSVIPAKDSITVDLDTIPADSAAAGEAAHALGELPGGSWLAVGTSNVAKSLPRNLAAISGLVSIGSSSVLSSIGGEGLAGFFKGLAREKAQLQSDLSGWAGSGGLFVGGTSVFDLQAGMVIDSSDPAASTAAVAKLGALFHAAGAAVAPTSIAGTQAAVTVRLNGFPLTLDMASGQGKLVIGIGEGSVTSALNPSSTFSSSAAYSAAQTTLHNEGQPTLVIEFPTLVGFIEGIGVSEDEGISGVLPYLRSFATLVGGEQQLTGGVGRVRAVLSFQQEESTESG